MCEGEFGNVGASVDISAVDFNTNSIIVNEHIVQEIRSHIVECNGSTMEISSLLENRFELIDPLDAVQQSKFAWFFENQRKKFIKSITAQINSEEIM